MNGIPFFPIDILFISAVKLTLPPSPKGSTSATGFLWAEGEEIYLVTSKHAVCGNEYVSSPKLVSYVKITFNRFGGSGTSSKGPPAVNDLKMEKCKIALSDSNVYFHPDSGIDVAMINANYCKLKGSAVYPFTRDNLPPPDMLLSPGDPLIVMGFPLDFYDHLKLLPIARAATLSTPYGLEYKGRKLFLTDSILHPGTSGSPVIYDPRVMMRTLSGVAIGTKLPPFILGIHSGEDPTIFSEYDIHLNNTWYSQLIPEILSFNGRA